MTPNDLPILPHDERGFLTGGEKLIKGMDAVKQDTQAIFALLTAKLNDLAGKSNGIRQTLQRIQQNTQRTVEAVQQRTASPQPRPTHDQGGQNAQPNQGGQGLPRPTIDSGNLGNAAGGQPPRVNLIHPDRQPQPPSPSPSPPRVNLIHPDRTTAPSPAPVPPPAPNQDRQRDDNGRFSSEGKQSIWDRFKNAIKGGVTEANVDTKNIDPTVDAVRELGEAMSPLFKVGKAMFKGVSWLFGKKKKQPPPSDQEQRQQTRIEKLLKRIAESRAGAAARSGMNLLGGIGGIGGALRSLPAFLAPLLGRLLIPALGLTAAFKLGEWIGGKIYNFIEPALTPLIDGIAAIPDTISKAWQGVVDIASKGIEAVVESFKGIKNKVQGAYEATVQGASNLIEKGANASTGFMNWGKGVYNKAVDKTAGAMTYVAGGNNPAPQTTKINSSKSAEKNQLMMHDAFVKAGFNPEQAKALTAEVGRENGYNDKFLYGTHGDAANAAVNQGVFSWQGDRKKKLVQFMQSRGLVGADGAFKQGQESLNAQAEFAKMELDSGQFKTGAFNAPNATAEQMAQGLGKGYIKWAYGQNVLKNGTAFDWQSHDNRRRGYLANLNAQLAVREGKVSAPTTANTAPPLLAKPTTQPTSYGKQTDSLIAAPMTVLAKTATPIQNPPKAAPSVAMKPIPDAPKVQQQVSSKPKEAKPTIAQNDTISQNVSDRHLAHAVTGGLGMDGMRYG